MSGHGAPVRLPAGDPHQPPVVEAEMPGGVEGGLEGVEGRAGGLAVLHRPLSPHAGPAPPDRTSASLQHSGL